MTDPHNIPDEPPPLLRTWPQVYVSILVYLAGVITLFYVFTKAFAP